MARPASLPRWATSGATITAPSSGKQDTGWTGLEKPSEGVFNWFWNLVYQWLLYLSAAATPTYVNRTTGTSYTANAFELVTLSLASPAPFSLALPNGAAQDFVTFKDITGDLAKNPLTVTVTGGGTIEGQSALFATLARCELTFTCTSPGTWILN